MTLVNCLIRILLRGLAIFHVYSLLSLFLRRFLHHSLSHEHLVLLLCIVYRGLVGNSIFKLISDAIRSVFEMGLKILRISLIITGCITICRRQILLYFGSAILIILFGRSVVGSNRKCHLRSYCFGAGSSTEAGAGLSLPAGSTQCIALQLLRRPRCQYCFGSNPWSYLQSWQL